MEFINKYFNPDKPKQYEGVRKTIASIHYHQPNCFGPVEECEDDYPNKTISRYNSY